ncbi:hypothetical protein BOTBODRAFT_246882 [Botryobasidium botryosum FD-172 SS1]|uniref:DUF7330 domain-containing protein n=1 Tax=Botryobasidium botryosum (strain FD-172 SS1) TaxID=930990 RepID=A0A067LW93_BOTB1|nr:hypothetical protein BOTBODRAFT_246882 [Botryobasidium botryosum FD-172 SS1]
MVFHQLQASDRHEHTATQENMQAISYSYTSAISKVSRAKAANYVQVQTDEQIEGTFTIDPELCVPSWMLPSLQPGRGTTRTHLFLESKEKSVDGLIHLVHSRTTLEDSPVPTRTLLEVTAYRGVTLDIFPRSPYSCNHLRFRLKVVVEWGNIVLRIPPDFHGPIRYTTAAAQARFSLGVREKMLVLTQKSKTGSCFIGEWAQPEGEDAVWTGDEIEVTSTSDYSSHKISFTLSGETDDE